ncbi:MAG: DUF1294 domain-containing protein [Hydrococcus sp. RU_2_2]|jgi:uncharacterized membrane protein YsdA (DUF1294 family)/cold shock CspA family protein|nr:DUF1294 domain-containing protein [Hydrococcus sp. RU_2_2]NJP21099.1 DUF1294 domain-containing protein [Hydrococcus sp. CRU_1_1]
MMRQGELVVWKDDRGFGFIKPNDGGQEIFLHITELKLTNRRPQVGDMIGYDLTVDKDGKVRACNAVIKNTISKPASNSLSSPSDRKAISQSDSKFLSLTLEVLSLSLLPAIGVIHFALKTFNPFPLILYTLMSLLTFVLYADDKSRAKQKRWRIPENTLHFCELTGGWLGAFVAQKILRHKNRKVSYQLVFWIIVGIHLVGWFDWLFLGGKLISLLLKNN